MRPRGLAEVVGRVDEDIAIRAVESVLEKGSKFSIASAEDFNRCVDHIVGLLNDAALLYRFGSYATSAFMSIAAIEEAGKSEMGLYIKQRVGKKVKKDLLCDHKKKETVAVMPTVAMGQRLVDALGNERTEELYRLTYSGDLKRLREDALYWDIKNGRLELPEEVVDKAFARDLLLFSIEVFDDRLVGYTHYSIEVSRATDKLFREIVGL